MQKKRTRQNTPKIPNRTTPARLPAATPTMPPVLIPEDLVAEGEGATEDVTEGTNVVCGKFR